MATFVPRLTAPTAANKEFVNYQYGGYNTCIVVNKTNGFCLENCVGYAQGRLLENDKDKKVNWKYPAANAEDWFAIAKKNGMATGQTPKLGAIIVWASGKVQNSSDGCGHVACVEAIAADGTITISESGYGLYMFKTEKVKAPYARTGMKFLGFVYPTVDYGTGDLGKETTTKTTTTTTTSSKITKGQAFKLKNTKVYANENGVSIGKRTGTYYAWESEGTEKRIRMTNSKARVGVAGQVSFFCEIADLKKL